MGKHDQQQLLSLFHQIQKPLHEQISQCSLQRLFNYELCDVTPKQTSKKAQKAKEKDTEIEPSVLYPLTDINYTTFKLVSFFPISPARQTVRILMQFPLIPE